MAALPTAPTSAAPQRQTDVRKRTVLPTTLQNLRSTASSSSQAELDLLNSDEYLDKLEEELNRKVDGEVDGLVEGLKELTALARLDPLTSHPSQPQLRSIQSQLRTQQMLRNAHSLLGMCHQLKLLHLFGDQETVQQGREAREVELRNQIELQKQRVDKLAARIPT